MLNITKRTTSHSIELTSAEERLVYSLQLLGDKTRFRIFKLLMTNENMCVTEIATVLGVSLSAVSQHFRSFEMLGLVDKERVGQKICYMLRYDDPLARELVGITIKSNTKN